MSRVASSWVVAALIAGSSVSLTGLFSPTHSLLQASDAKSDAAVVRDLAVPDKAETKDAKKPRYRIDRGDLESPQWTAAIETAKRHSAGKGHYSLMRVFVDDAVSTQEIQVQGTKLKDLTENDDGGGGTYRTETNGKFVFLEHINSDRRQDGRDPVKLGSFPHGLSTVWVEVPANGELGIVGDVILDRCPVEEMGLIRIQIKGDDLPLETSVTIGPLVVGGPYGKKVTFDTTSEVRLRSAPGTYKILFPEYDLRASRWDVEIEAGKSTDLTFDVARRKISKTNETKSRIVE